MGDMEIQYPQGNRRYIRLFAGDEHVAYWAKYCDLCKQWMDETNGHDEIVDGIAMGWVCQLHD